MNYYSKKKKSNGINVFGNVPHDDLTFVSIL